MIYFLCNMILWTLALYGGIEIIKTIIYSKSSCIPIIKDNDGVFLILATKNQEKSIEGILRTYLEEIKYEESNDIKEILLVDLDSEDKTKYIAKKISEENNYIKVMEWEKCKSIIENIKSSQKCNKE